jgi:hypothetical protein
MQHLDEGTIHAWLDGELPPAEREAAEAHVAQCDQCAAAVAEARGFIAASSRILLTLDAVPGGVLPAAQGSSAPAGMRTPARFTVSRAWMAAAAVLILSTATVIAVHPRTDNDATTMAQRDEMRASHADTTVSTPVAAPAMAAAPDEKKNSNALAPNAPAPNPAALAEERQKSVDKRAGALAPARKDARAREGGSDSTPMMVAGAARASEADSTALSDRKPSATAMPPATAGQAADALVAKTESRAAPAAVRVEAQSGVAGASTAVSLRQRVPESRTSQDYDVPQVVSRSTTKENGDTVVTTVYSVNGVPVSLIDESSSSRTALQFLRSKTSLANQPMTVARDSASAMNSITWSDSTGRTRTLRGAMTQAELQRLKRALFGPTP